MTRARSDKRERTTRVYFVHAVSLLDRFVAGLDDRIVLGPGYLSRTDRGRGRERGPEDDAPSKTYSIVAPSFPLILRPRAVPTPAWTTPDVRRGGRAGRITTQGAEQEFEMSD